VDTFNFLKDAASQHEDPKVKKIMEDHGGRLVLDDRPDSPGAVASLTLPNRPMVEAQAVQPRVMHGA
jgi:hypothetical protein